MTTQQLPAQAPDFTLESALGQSVALSEFRGRNVVIVFGGKDSGEQMSTGIDEVRTRMPPDQLRVITVLDMRSLPRPARMIAKKQIKKRYEDAVQKTRAAYGEQAAKEVTTLVDWPGKVTDQFGLSGVDREAVAVAVDPNGRILGSGSGSQLGSGVLAAFGK